MSKLIGEMSVADDKKTSFNMSTVQTVDRCQCCGQTDASFIIKYQEYNIWQCTSCKSMSYRPDQDIRAQSLYNEKYFSGGEYLNYTAHRHIHEVNAARKWKKLSRYLPDRVSALEIGCAYGYFLNHIKHQPGVESVFGLDISREAIASARNEFGDFFAEFPEVPGGFKYNCLFLWDVWEHLEKPYQNLEIFYQNLQPGGIVALTTLDAGSPVARWRGKKWRQMHPPTHIHYPNQLALQQHFSKQGFEVLEQSYFSPLRASEVYFAALGLQNMMPGFLRLQPFALNLFDIQFLVARKI